MPNDVLTLDGIEQQVSGMLGGSGVVVELTRADYRSAAQAALREYSRAVPFRQPAALTVSAGQQKYGPLNTLHPSFMGVEDVDWIVGDPESPVIDVFDPRTYFTPALFPCMTPGDWEQERVYRSDVRKQSARPAYQGQWEADGNYYLYIRVSAYDPTYCTYTWNGKYILEAPATLPVQGVLLATLIPEDDVQWVLDFIAAECKLRLARIRGKFQGVPNTEGSVDQMDGSDLASEARDDKTRLMEELNNRARPILPIRA